MPYLFASYLLFRFLRNLQQSVGLLIEDIGIEGKFIYGS